MTDQQHPADATPRSAESWRAVIAALANETARTVFAELTLTGASPTLDTLSPARRRQMTRVLVGSGLARSSGATLELDGRVFARLLTEPSRKKTGVARFLDGDGRITVYPANKRARGELLADIAESALEPGEVVSEQEINERLRAFSDDVAVLRRYLVDYGELERTRSGTEYARPARARV